MTEQHTSGPWAPMLDGPTDRNDPWKPWSAYREPSPGLTIGSTEHTEPICRVSGYLHDVVANARLIAAAPALLEACRGVLDAMRASGCYEITQDADLDIREAIALATSKP